MLRVESPRLGDGAHLILRRRVEQTYHSIWRMMMNRFAFNLVVFSSEITSSTIRMICQ
jgi:hypothetical protein